MTRTPKTLGHERTIGSGTCVIVTHQVVRLIRETSHYGSRDWLESRRRADRAYVNQVPGDRLFGRPGWPVDHPPGEPLPHAVDWSRVAGYSTYVDLRRVAPPRPLYGYVGARVKRQAGGVERSGGYEDLGGYMSVHRSWWLHEVVCFTPTGFVVVLAWHEDLEPWTFEGFPQFAMVNTPTQEVEHAGV